MMDMSALMRWLPRPGAVTADPDILRSHGRDLRGWFEGEAAVLIRPADLGEVQAAVRACAELALPIIAQGGNTGLVGSGVPRGRERCAIVTLRGLRQIRSRNANASVLIAESGCTLAEVKAAAVSIDRHFGVDVGARDTAQIGGLIGTNAGGMEACRYGVMRDQVLGLEVMLPDGSLLEALRTVRKDNTGYDLRSLFVGAEGTLGIVTAASLRLHPPERHSVTAVCLVETVADAATCARLLTEAGLVSAVELMPAWAAHAAAEKVLQAPLGLSLSEPWLVLARFAGANPVDAHAETALGAVLHSGLATDAVLAPSGAQEGHLWRVRDAFSPLHRHLGTSARFDLSVPLDAIPQLIAQAQDVVAKWLPQGRLLAFGHLADGNIHVSACDMGGPHGLLNLDLKHAIEQEMHAVCWSLGGSISAEHGIGQLHRHELKAQKSATERALLHRIKATLDPDNMFNPGKLLPAEEECQ